MNVVFEHAADHYVLFPAISPMSKAEASTVEKQYRRAASDLIGGRLFKGTRRAGTVVDKVSWPYSLSTPLSSGDGVRKAAAILPPGTQYLGAVLQPGSCVKRRAPGWPGRGNV